MTARLYKFSWGRVQLLIEWRLALFTAVLFPCLVALGFWQLDRAGEKRDLAARHAARGAMVALSDADLFQALAAPDAPGRAAAALADRRVLVAGTLDPDRYLLIDNRIMEGRFGYEVVALLAATEGHIPVNLGWIAGDPARRSLPDPELEAGYHSVSGHLHVPQKAPFLLAEQQAPEALPAVVQAYEAAVMGNGLSGVLGASVLPAVVRIAPEDPLALRTNWTTVNQSPEKHTGYAVQWFAMAAVLLLAFLLRSSNVWPLLVGRRSQQP